ncbi:traB domain-containing protein [Pyrus ussuriensis x Pyrus communis]|uniref:TraB domain-containing protein n=1 Tax=Pyrus ussuriensis x Pyrus communis TaxID=2448454 RepID=A0A5N5F0H6_9ROSA|nr:traB domain-containing protein [Pyrus ussuriensis x Pyrus communis]
MLWLRVCGGWMLSSLYATNFRAGIMYADASRDSETGGQQLRSNVFSLNGTGFFGAIGGQTALALRLLLVIFSSKISSDTNRPFGDEWGDRPIEITLEGAWNSLNWDEKLSLVSSVVRGITSPSDISKKIQVIAHLTSQLYEQLSSSYPSLLQPLIYERDTYFAWSLKRSKAVNKSKRVVGVIGKGCMNGRPTSAPDASCNGWIVKLVQDLISHYYCHPLVGII